MQKDKKIELLDINEAESPFEEEMARKLNEILIELENLVKEEKQMSKFKVGDIIKGKGIGYNKYFPFKDIYKAEIEEIHKHIMEIKILEHRTFKKEALSGTLYIVPNDSKYFELVKDD